MSLFIFLTVLQALIGAALVGVILVQRSEGGGLTGGGNPSGLMSARGAANFLTRMTTILAVGFVGLSIVLAAVAVGANSGTKIDTSLKRAAPATAPVDPLNADPLAGVGAPSRRSVTTDAAGGYRFDHVALTAFRVQGCDSPFGLPRCAAASGAATSGGVTVNLALSQPGSLNGTVFADGSGAVVSFADVYVVNRDHAGPFYPGGFRRNLFTEANGRYSGANLPAGSYTVIAEDYSTKRAGIASGVLSPGGTATIDVTFGNATTFPLVLDGATNGFRYDIGCDGSLQSGGQPAQFQLAFSGGASVLNVAAGPNGAANTFFGCVDGAPLTMNNRGVTIEGGTFDAAGVDVTRKIFVPEGAEFGRYLEVLTNRTPIDLTVRIGMTGRLAMADEDTHLTARPADTSNTVAVFEDGSFSRSSVGFVLGGQGAPVTALPTTIAAGNSAFKYEWVVTVPAGQTRSLLHFVVQGPSSGAAAVGTQSFGLANLTDPNALAGLTAAEKASIVNFVIH